MDVSCPACGKKFSAPASAAGHDATCACGHRFTIPGAPLILIVQESKQTAPLAIITTPAPLAPLADASSGPTLFKIICFLLGGIFIVACLFALATQQSKFNSVVKTSQQERAQTEPQFTRSSEPEPAANKGGGLGIFLCVFVVVAAAVGIGIAVAKSKDPTALVTEIGVGIAAVLAFFVAILAIFALSGAFEEDRDTKRPLNFCEHCGWSWYPKGHDYSRQCPSCNQPC